MKNFNGHITILSWGNKVFAALAWPKSFRLQLGKGKLSVTSTYLKSFLTLASML